MRDQDSPFEVTLQEKIFLMYQRWRRKHQGKLTYAEYSQQKVEESIDKWIEGCLHDFNGRFFFRYISNVQFRIGSNGKKILTIFYVTDYEK